MDPQNQNNRYPPTQWTRFEDKLFEEALVYFPEETPDRWHKIADRIPGKSAEKVKQHFDMLLHDVYEIDAGRIKVPNYADGFSELSLGSDSDNQISFALKPEQQQQIDKNERKKGTPWTEDEHKLFLLGLSQYGKGDWRSISRNVVVTRTPTQVASHAQKFFLRQSQTSGKKERKRSSIHDITTVNVNAPVDQSLVSMSTGLVQQPSLLQQLPPPNHNSRVNAPVEQIWVPMPSGPVQQPSTLQQLHPPNHLAPDGQQLPSLNYLPPDGQQLPPPKQLPPDEGSFGN